MAAGPVVEISGGWRPRLSSDAAAALLHSASTGSLPPGLGRRDSDGWKMSRESSRENLDAGDSRGPSGHLLRLRPVARLQRLLRSVLRGVPAAVSRDGWPHVVLLCALWYTASALTNNLSKQLMNIVSIPVTLTWIQFAFVAGFCAALAPVLVDRRPIQRLDWHVFQQTAVISCFQIGGHIFSSVALTRVSVSLAHTVKATSPLFTVLLYRSVYSIKYSRGVYASLVPLTLGVMLVCASRIEFDSVGLLCALAATVIFVVQNVISKRILVVNQPTQRLPASAASAPAPPRLDKMSMLFYTGSFACLFMVPLWLYSEGFLLVTDPTNAAFQPLHASADRPRGWTLALQAAALLLANGVTHFMQNLFAFSVLALVSPVHYSVASLVKRIVVISASIAWFGDAVNSSQASGLLLTFVGLYMYQKARTSVDRGEEKWEAQVEAQAEASAPQRLSRRQSLGPASSHGPASLRHSLSLGHRRLLSTG